MTAQKRCWSDGFTPMTLLPADLPLDDILCPPAAYPPVLPEFVIRTNVSDFVVEEIPLYEPSGAGEHLYLLLQKTDVPAGDLIRLLAGALQVAQRDIGVAGQKDRRAVTQQFVSVPVTCESRVADVNIPGVQLISAVRHGNKLRTGHLKGNRFRLRCRLAGSQSATAEHVRHVRSRLARLEESGFPNYFGPQRFGHHGNTLRDGLRRLQQDSPDSSGKRRQRSSRFLNSMSASAVQSAVFNLVLAERVRQGTYAVPQAGDVVCSRTGIRPFAFNDRGDTPAEDLIPMGPMPGPRMFPADGLPLQQEQQAAEQLGLTSDSFATQRHLGTGTRRRFAEFPGNTGADLLPDGAVEISFELPAGSFATVLLAELGAFSNWHPEKQSE